MPRKRIPKRRVGDVLVEGKLSPDTAEVDRLIGQISDYTKYSVRRQGKIGGIDKLFRIASLSILPAAVLGKESRNTTCLGIL